MVLNSSLEPFLIVCIIPEKNSSKFFIFSFSNVGLTLGFVLISHICPCIWRHVDSARNELTFGICIGKDSIILTGFDLVVSLVLSSGSFSDLNHVQDLLDDNKRLFNTVIFSGDHDFPLVLDVNNNLFVSVQGSGL